MICAERFFRNHHICLPFCLLLLAGSAAAQGGDFEIPDYRGLRLLSGMLHFRTQADFDAAYDDLTNRQHEWYENAEALPDDPVPGAPCPDPDPLLEAFEQKIGLQSVRKKFVQLECELLEAGQAPEAVPDHYLVDDVLAAFFNEQYQIRIGNDLYYLPAPQLQFKVRNADYAALEALVRGANPYQLANVEVLESGQGCNASFTINADENSTTVGFAFTGTPQTGDVSYLWEFGDGQSAFVENPTHQYTSNGSYNVCLTVEAAGTEVCWDKKCQEIQVGTGGLCLPFFIFNETGNPGELCFVDATPIIGNVESLTWDFGDGSPTVSGTNPCHTYGCDKVYYVSLSITTSTGCVGSITEPVWVNSNACCAKYASYSDYKYFGVGNTRRIKHEQWHIHLPFLHRVAAKVKYYELNSNNNWRLERADLRLDFEGMVFTKTAAGCKCQVPFIVNGLKLAHDKKRLSYSRPVGQDFKAKKTAEWLVRYWVEGVEIWEQKTPVTCD